MSPKKELLFKPMCLYVRSRATAEKGSNGGTKGVRSQNPFFFCPGGGGGVTTRMHERGHEMGFLLFCGRQLPRRYSYPQTSRVYLSVRPSVRPCLGEFWATPPTSRQERGAHKIYFFKRQIDDEKQKSDKRCRATGPVKIHDRPDPARSRQGIAKEIDLFTPVPIIAATTTTKNMSTTEIGSRILFCPSTSEPLL